MKKSTLIALIAVALLGIVMASGLWDTRSEHTPPPSAPASTPEPSIPTRTRSSPPASDVDQVPPVLGPLPLVEAITGAEGAAQVSALHGKGVGVVAGYVARYSGAGGQAILWVGVAPDEAAAHDLTERMTDKIGPSHAVFSQPQALSIEGQTVYATTGQGQQHYYFQAGDGVVWLAVSGPQAGEVLSATLALFP